MRFFAVLILKNSGSGPENAVFGLLDFRKKRAAGASKPVFGDIIFLLFFISALDKRKYFRYILL